MKFVTHPHPNRPNPKSPHAWDLKRRARGGACLQGNSLSVCSGLTPQRSPKGPGRPSKSVLIPSHLWCVGSMRHCPGGGMQTHFFGFFPRFFSPSILTLLLGNISNFKNSVVGECLVWCAILGRKGQFCVLLRILRQMHILMCKFLIWANVANAEFGLQILKFGWQTLNFACKLLIWKVNAQFAVQICNVGLERLTRCIISKFLITIFLICFQSLRWVVPI